MTVKVRSVDRVSIAVRSLEAARAFFEQHFGAEFGEVQDVAVDGYRSVPFTVAGFALELLEPYRPDNPIANFLRKHGEGLYQLSLLVGDLDHAVAGLEGAGLDVIGPRTDPDDVGPDGCCWREAHVHPRDAFGVLVSLGETAPVGTPQAAIARSSRASSDTSPSRNAGPTVRSSSSR